MQDRGSNSPTNEAHTAGRRRTGSEGICRFCPHGPPVPGRFIGPLLRVAPSTPVRERTAVPQAVPPAGPGRRSSCGTLGRRSTWGELVVRQDDPARCLTRPSSRAGPSGGCRRREGCRPRRRPASFNAEAAEEPGQERGEGSSRILGPSRRSSSAPWRNCCYVVLEVQF